MTNLVYILACKICNKEYVGETKCPALTRFKEYLDVNAADRWLPKHGGRRIKTTRVAIAITKKKPGPSHVRNPRMQGPRWPGLCRPYRLSALLWRLEIAHAAKAETALIYRSMRLRVNAISTSNWQTMEPRIIRSSNRYLSHCAVDQQYVCNLCSCIFLIALSSLWLV